MANPQLPIQMGANLPGLDTEQNIEEAKAQDEAMDYYEEALGLEPGDVEEEVIELEDGSTMDAKTPVEPVSDEFYYIVPDKCTECTGFHEEPQCAAVCPVDCCVHDELYQETVDQLLAKKEKLHS